MVAVLLLSCEVTEAASTFITVLSVLMVSRVITVAQAFEGYSNPLVLAIAFLFVVAKVRLLTIAFPFSIGYFFLMRTNIALIFRALRSPPPCGTSSGMCWGNRRACLWRRCAC